ncbi:MAG TPA: hypothetical protein VM074_12395 [Solimonas sp.]|nr:hypothetical protein [Solimonas sp.]
MISNRLAALGLALSACGFCGTALAETRVNGIYADRVNRVLYVDGFDFTSILGALEIPYVELNGARLPVISGTLTNSHLEATLPANLADGEYQVFISKVSSLLDLNVLQSAAHTVTATQRTAYSLTLATPIPGPQGIQGLTGAQGPAGAIGPTGPQGLTGPAGAIGPQGLQGLTGAAGPAGAIGPQGLQGLTGPAGAIGPQGPTGAAGAAGAQGLQGLQGPQGPAGLLGLQGPAGPQGATGPAGPQGPQGPQGAPGSNGVAGLVIVTATSASLGSVARIGATAVCPAGKKTLGGGFLVQGAGSNQVMPVGSAAYAANSYSAIIQRIAGQTGTIEATVVAQAFCATVQ